MDTKLKTPTELLKEDNEYSQAILFASNYKDANPDMDNYVTTSMLADFLIKFKKEHIDKDWYNAGIMSQRILQNYEIKQLKEKLKNSMEGQGKLVEHFNRSEEENQVLRTQNAALQERIKIMNAALHPNE